MQIYEISDLVTIKIDILQQELQKSHFLDVWFTINEKSIQKLPQD